MMFYLGYDPRRLALHLLSVAVHKPGTEQLCFRFGQPLDLANGGGEHIQDYRRRVYPESAILVGGYIRKIICRFRGE